jgi:hypothetical protein
LGPTHNSLTSCSEAQHIMHNSTKFVSHENIGCIKFMIRHMRNIRTINIRSIRDMVSVVDALLLLLVSVAHGELDELFAI